MKKTRNFGAVLAALAPTFNKLLGIPDTYFGRTGRSGPGAGVKRAQARLAAKLKANQSIPDGSYVSRQQRRRAAILAAKPSNQKVVRNGR